MTTLEIGKAGEAVMVEINPLYKVYKAGSSKIYPIKSSTRPVEWIIATDPFEVEVEVETEERLKKSGLLFHNLQEAKRVARRYKVG